MIQAFLADGTPVILSQELGRGGEALVLQVDRLPNLVAKIYHQPSLDRQMKLEAMIARPPSDPTAEQNHISICWPTALIFDQSRRCLGFLMPRVDYAMSVPVFMLYNPKDRWRVRAGFTWRYLLRTAVNISSAIEAVHAKGYVVGDLNESNIMVAETALVTLVDCDSMQVPQPAKAMFYRCPVGKPEYTPPELQSVDFSTTDRNPTHDNFGLAVMIFQLLMEGIHPFAGVTKGVDMSVQERIRRGESPYAGSHVIRPMPIAPPFGILPRDIQSLLLRCFQEGHTKPSARPDAREWRVALTAAEQELAVCPRNAQHVYSKHYALYECPWCERTATFGGIDPFPEPGKQMALPAPLARNVQRDSAVIKQRQHSNPALAKPESKKQRRALLKGSLLLLLLVAGATAFWMRPGRQVKNAAIPPVVGCGINEGNLDQFLHLSQGAISNKVWTYQVEYTMPALCQSGSLVVDGSWVANYLKSSDEGKPVRATVELPSGAHIRVSIFSEVEAMGLLLATKYIDTPKTSGNAGAVSAGIDTMPSPGCPINDANINNYVQLVEEGFGKDSWIYRAEFSMPSACPNGSLEVEGNIVAKYDRKKDAHKTITNRVHLQPGARFKVRVLSGSGTLLASRFIDTRFAPNSKQGDLVQTVGTDVSAPQLFSIIAGDYTDEARKARVEGTVTIEAVFGRDGKIRDPRILTSLGSGLDEKAIEAVMHATARPGMKNGQPVSVRYKVGVSFRLPPETAPKAVTGTFQVVHEHLLGIIGQGCAGRLIIAGDALRFESSKHPQKFLREDISALDTSGPGFTDRDRKHWKFHVESDQRQTRQEKSEKNVELMKALDGWLHSK